MCAYLLVVSEKKTTSKYLDSFKRNGPNKINLTNIIACECGKGVEKKVGNDQQHDVMVEDRTKQHQQTF